jgi:hypothetical protein
VAELVTQKLFELNTLEKNEQTQARNDKNNHKKIKI